MVLNGTLMNTRNTIILTVNNKEKTIIGILKGLTSTLSADTVRIIVILDGCTDTTKEIVELFISKSSDRFKFDVISTDDIWETKANNIGLMMVNTPYATLVQDDMLLKEKSWDRKLLNIFLKYNVFAVTGRTAHNFSLIDGQFNPVNLVGREYPLGSDNIIGKLIAKLMVLFKPYWIYKFITPVDMRLTVNRGPLVLNMLKARKLNFFDEQFAPFELDDVDLCCRAFKQYGLYSAACPVYYLEIGGSKVNSSKSSEVSRYSIEKNTKILIERHSNLAVT